VLAGLGACKHSHPRTKSLATGDQYVALGDSATAAPGTGPMSDVACLQSSTNYPHRVATTLGLDLVDVSCSGATTEDVAEGQVFRQAELPPQADALSDSADLVTIGLGANDFKVFGTVVLSCAALRDTNPAGSPCKAAWSCCTSTRAAGRARPIPTS